MIAIDDRQKGWYEWTMLLQFQILFTLLKVPVIQSGSGPYGIGRGNKILLFERINRTISTTVNPRLCKKEKRAAWSWCLWSALPHISSSVMKQKKLRFWIFCSFEDNSPQQKHAWERTEYEEEMFPSVNCTINLSLQWKDPLWERAKCCLVKCTGVCISKIDSKLFSNPSHLKCFRLKLP